MLFRLRTPHVIEGAIRNPGTIVGPYGSNATVVLNGPPSPDMEGVDDEGKAAVNEVYRTLHGTDAPWHLEPAKPGQPLVPGQVAAPEQPYVEDHPDYQEISNEDRAKGDQELLEANQRHWDGHGTGIVQTIPAPGASVTAVRPMTTETPQDQAIRPDRPLGQQLPDTMGSVGGTSPNAEAAKQAAVQEKKEEPKPVTPSVPRRVTPNKEDC